MVLFAKEEKKKEKEEIKTFSEVTKAKVFEAEKQEKFTDLVNKEFIVLDFTALPSRFDPPRSFVVLYGKHLNGTTFTCATGSTVIMKQLEQVKEHLPIKVTLKKVKRYFTFQ